MVVVVEDEAKTGLRTGDLRRLDSPGMVISSVSDNFDDSDVVALHHHHSPRLLGEPDVGLYVSGGEGTCQIRNSLDTLYNGENAAFGAVFTVQALTDPLDIQGIEFANNLNAGDEGAVVNIYVLPNANGFSSNKDDWIKLASTTSVASPDGIGSIAPRADFTRSVAISPGNPWTFYVALENGNLKMADSTATGTSYQQDDFLRLNVGESLASGAEFTAARTANRAFQGKLHYRVLKPCNTLATETEFVFPFATEAGTDRVALNAAVSAGFEQLLIDEKDLVRWVNLYGLVIKTINLKSKGSQDDCSEYDIEGGCDLYDSDLVLGHFESLGARELVLEFLLKLNNRNGLGALQDDLKAVYNGDKVFEQQYAVTLTGVPFGTVLNPIQREYLEKVTYDFLDEFSDAEPYRVEIRQSVDDTRRLLRGGRDETLGAWDDRRGLQAPAVVRAEAIVYGIGDDRKEFLEDLEAAFLKNTEQYKEEVQKQQYLPGEINDRSNLGSIFSEILGVQVKRTGPDEAVTGSSGQTADDGVDSTQIQIISFSVAIGLAFLYLVYRVMKDCVMVQDGWAVKNEKLSEKTENSSSRPELSNMDKPRQRSSVAVDVDSLAKVKLSSMDDSSMTDGPARRGRRPPSGRGVGRAKSSDAMGDSTSTAQPPKSKSDFTTEPRRGVARNKSADGDFMSSRAPTSSRSASREPTRGVGRAKSTDDLDFGMARRPVSAHSRGPPPSRGVGVSKSSDLSAMAGATRRPFAPSGQGRAAPASRGVGASRSFGGVEGFLGGAQGNGAANGAPATKRPGKKKKKKKNAGNGEASPGTPKKKKKSKSNASLTSDGSGSKKKPTSAKSVGAKGTKPKKKKSRGEENANGKPPKPPRRVDMAGPASPRVN